MAGAGDERKALKMIGNRMYWTRSEGAQGGARERGDTIKLIR